MAERTPFFEKFYKTGDGTFTKLPILGNLRKKTSSTSSVEAFCHRSEAFPFEGQS